MGSHRTIHWFRKGLRLHDNPALVHACLSSSEMWPVFVLDPWFVTNGNVGCNRWRFLQQTLTDLDESLKKLNSRLYVVRGSPQDVFPKLFSDWEITQLTYEVDTEPYAKSRDAAMDALAEKSGVTVVKRVSHTLFDTKKTITQNGGSAPLTYQRCQTVLSQLGPPRKPAVTISEDHMKGCLPNESRTLSEDHHVPSLEELVKDTDELGENHYPGGESEALKRMEKYLEKTAWICGFEKPQTSPNSLEASTTVLSPYLKFGCLSARTFYWKLQDVYKGRKHSSPPVSLEGQLLWREFFYTVATATPNFNKMEGNAVCRQIPWDHDEKLLEAWTQGRTGYPFIDAIMIQLRREGWIHHLARHAVACFLTRGDLWQSWEQGQRVFEELLLDADWSLNAGNWMWLSASAFFHQYFRVYSPVAFGKKTDKNGNYIKKYLPQLKKFPAQYIYEPWKAPLTLQTAAGCIIGKDYPRPIVDHDVVRKRNIERMAKAYNNAKAKDNSKGDKANGKRKSTGSTNSLKKKKV